MQNHNSKGKKNPQKTELSPSNVSQQQCKSVKSQFSKDPNATATKSNVKSKPLNQQNSKDNIQMKFLEEFCEQVYSNVLGLSAQEHLPEENGAGSGQSSEQATDTDRSKNKRDKQEAQSSAVPKKKNRRQHGHIKVPPGLKELGLVKAPYFENKDELCKCVSGFFEKARSYAPCYTNILNRYAHFLWHIGKEDEAMEIHEESIDIDKCESNWFAFKSMGENLRKKYKDEWYDRVHQKSDKNPRIELALKAKEKLEIAVQHNPNPQDYAYLAETCHFLGIDTNRQVTDEKMLLKALYYFKYATNNLQGGRIPMLHHLLGLCLLDLGEKRNALESFKNALQCQEPNSTFTISFRCMMLVLLQICKSAKTKSDDRTYMYRTALRELRHWLIEGCHPNRYLEKELLKEISELWGPRKEPFEPDILTELCVKLKDGKQDEQNVSSLLEKGLKLCIDKYPKQPAPTAGSEPAERGDLHVSQLRTCLEKIQLAPTPKAAEPVSMPGAAVDVPEVVMGSSQTSQDVLKEATPTSQSTYRGVDETTLAVSQALPQALDPNSVKTSVVQEEGRSLEEKGAGMLPSEMPPNLLPPDSNEDDTYRPASAQSEYTSSSVQVEPLTDIVRTGDPEAQDTFQQERREARNDTLTADKPAKSEEIHEKNDKEIQCDISTEPPSDMMGQVPSSPPLAYCFESKRAKNLKGMEYDFFVMYCDSDADFVSFHLLTTLENSKELKGCIKDRDFMPGQIVLNCVTNAIKNSSKVIAVISHASVKDSDWLYEIHLAIKEYNKRGSLALQSSKLPSSYVIPILCENEAGELPIMPEVFEVFAAAKVPFDRKDCNWDKLEKAIRDDE
ncbi:uncharacterized protein LOC106175381 [Lingula anatina]|uniref:Uncharacterized protein LOC106175381 n=1 Tax=Lingula anatina TaxID=7574 RepID=A0A1S3JRS4_LINAN|nr:uncharacterized protein LOC106175381 [Lingula anatina]|eukprot:XP_013412796.1 uncharacterized protein LOC106175381 [Lingula anatina]